LHPGNSKTLSSKEKKRGGEYYDYACSCHYKRPAKCKAHFLKCSSNNYSFMFTLKKWQKHDKDKIKKGSSMLTIGGTGARAVEIILGFPLNYYLVNPSKERFIR
jgi:hypothetical protein